MTGDPVSVLLVDDQPLLSLGFRLVLEAQPDITVPRRSR
jgi:DNA-binding NarL/FixJ family response regulator